MITINRQARDPKDAIAFVREGKLYLGLQVFGNDQRNGYLDTRNGKVYNNGTGTIPSIAHWDGADLIYPGDSVTITFDGK